MSKANLTPSELTTAVGALRGDVTMLKQSSILAHEKADQAIAVGNGSHQQIADLNRAMVSTIAKSDDALKASATALRSITQCEEEISTLAKAYDVRMMNLKRDIEELRNQPLDKAVFEGISKLRDDYNKLNDQHGAFYTGLSLRVTRAIERIEELDSHWRQQAKVGMERQAEYRKEWDTLNRQIARLSDAVSKTQAEFVEHVRITGKLTCDHADVEARLSSLEEELRGNRNWKPSALRDAGIAITEAPHERRYLVIVMYDGGTIAGKSGFKNNDAAMKWFEGYVKRCREAFNHDPKRYTYIILSEMT